MYFLYAALFSGFLPILLLAYKNFPRTSVSPLIFLVALGTIYEVFFTMILKWETALWFSTYDVLSLIAISYFFYRGRILGKRYLLFILAVFMILQIVGIAGVYEKVFNFDMTTLIFTTLIVIAGSTWWIIKSMRGYETIRYHFIPEFYFISGLLIYYTATFLLFMTDQLIPNILPELKHEFWAVNIGATLVYRLILSLGLWKIPTQ